MMLDYVLSLQYILPYLSFNFSIWYFEQKQWLYLNLCLPKKIKIGTFIDGIITSTPSLSVSTILYWLQLPSCKIGPNSIVILVRFLCITTSVYSVIICACSTILWPFLCRESYCIQSLTFLRLDWLISLLLPLQKCYHL